MKLAFPLDVSRPDFPGHVQLLKDCGVLEIPVYFMEYDQPVRPMEPGDDLDRMLAGYRRHMADIAANGLASHVLYVDFRLKPADVMAEDTNAQAWFGTLCKESAALGIREIGFFPNNPAREQTDAAWDQNQAAGYGKMADIAAESGIRISTHLNMINGSRYDRPEDLDDLFDRVGRDNFGLLFCFGCIALAGLDLADAIYRWRDRIFVVHVRDVAGYWGSQMAEKQFGTGRINLANAVAALRQIGYDGILHPEHFPIFDSELPDQTSPLFTHAWDRKLLTTVWTLGFWRGMLAV